MSNLFEENSKFSKSRFHIHRVLISVIKDLQTSVRKKSPNFSDFLKPKCKFFSNKKISEKFAKGIMRYAVKFSNFFEWK